MRSWAPMGGQSHNWVVTAAVAALLVVGAGTAGYVSGRSGGRDVEVARQVSAAAGQTKGSAQGATEGYARGVKSGRERGYNDAYPGAYEAAYLEEFRNAGLDAPQRVSIPQP